MNRLKKLYNLIDRNSKLSLENVIFLNKKLGYPTDKYPTVHIAGSNGKGSVTTKISKALIASNLKVGIYTSPHIHSIRERIAINDELIKEKELSNYLRKIFAVSKTFNINPTFFETITMAAFLHFMKKDVDIAIIEVGLGGALDATNIIKPILTIITSICLDHTKILGDTLDKIALEKAGIIKKNVPLILGEKVSFKAILDKAKENNARVVFAKLKDNQGYDRESIAISGSALKELLTRFNIKKDVIEKSILKRPECRFEIFKKEDENFPKALILDIAHNYDSIKRVFSTIEREFLDTKINVFFAMSKNKNIKQCLYFISKKSEYIYLTSFSHDRLEKPEIFAKILDEFNYKNYFLYNDFKDGFFSAVKKSSIKKEVLLVCGSFFMMSPIKKLINTVWL